jgi:hypothetical protein
MIEQGLREILPTSVAPRETDCADPARAETDATLAVSATADLIAEIKSTFGVSITDLAAIIGASRRTIYDWLGGGAIDPADYERLLSIKRLAATWVTLAKLPEGGLLHPKGADRCALLDLLRENPLDSAPIRSHMEALAGKLAHQRAEARRRLDRLAPLNDKDRYENMLTHVFPAADQ